MTKRFIIALASATPEQERGVQDWILKNGVGWWHWLPGFWLIVDPQGLFSASAMRDHLDLILPGVHKLVLEFSEAGDTWAGFGPTGNKRDMFEWIRSTWK